MAMRVDEGKLTSDEKSLYLATLLEVFHDALESEVGLAHAILKCGQVFRVLGKRALDCVVDELRDGPLGLDSF